MLVHLVQPRGFYEGEQSLNKSNLGLSSERHVHLRTSLLICRPGKCRYLNYEHAGVSNLWFTGLFDFFFFSWLWFLIVGLFLLFPSFICGRRGGGRTRCCVRSFALESLRRDRNKKINRSLIFWFFSSITRLCGWFFREFSVSEKLLMSVVLRRWVNVGVCV